MYLISIYFDEATDKRIRGYMKQIARHSKNNAMLEGEVPPHITIGAFHAGSERCAKEIFEKAAAQISQGEVHWVSVGTFLPQVIFLSAVLNEYLHELSVIISNEILAAGETLVSHYQPFYWLPHATLAKTLNKEQMRIAFEVMQNQFGPFQSVITKVGLAKTNPYTDIAMITLEEVKQKGLKTENKKMKKI